MSVTTCSYIRLHQNYFAEQSYCFHISSLVFIPAQLRRFTVTVVDSCILKFSMILPRRWLQPLVGVADYIGNFSNHNGMVSPSPLLIVIFWSFSVIPPHIWARLLFWVAAYIGTTILSDRIIAIYPHCISPSTMVCFRRHRRWLLYFEVFYDSSYLLTATTRSDSWLHWKLLCWAMKSSLYIMIFFSLSIMASFHRHHFWMLYFEVSLSFLPTD